MKLERAYRHFRAFKIGISKKKVSGNFFRFRGAVGCKKVKKKKKKRKLLYGTFFLAIFLFPMIKRAEKVSGFVNFRKGRGKK